MDSKLKKCISEIIDIKATNKSPLYNNMLYWSQKPYNVCSCLIKNLSKNGDTILDPFMGSGVTIIESVNKSNIRKAIGVDINDMPLFLCKTALMSCSQDNIKKLIEFKDIIDDFQKYYFTKCDKCGNEKAINKKLSFDIEPTYKFTELEYKCTCDKKVLKKKPSKDDIDNYHKNHKIASIDNINLLEDSRVAVKKGEKISDKFSNRNFYILDKIRNEIDNIKDKKVQNILLYIFASIIHKSKILDYKMGSQWALWIPKKNCIERNVVDIMKESIDRYIESVNFVSENYYLDSVVEKYNKLDINKALIIKKPIQNISGAEVPDESVDLVVTDPPYLSQVPYSEYMQLYKGFLKNDINFENEIVISNANGGIRNYDYYIKTLRLAFANVSRMMKNESYLCMYFHDSNLKFWRDLISIMRDNDLNFVTSVHIDKKQKTLKKILDPKKTMNGESLLFFVKSLGEDKKDKELTNKDKNDIKSMLFDMFENKKYISTSELFDNGLLEFLIKKSLLKSVSEIYNDFTELLQEFIEWDDNVGLWRKK